jgi:hypothetical protein
VSGPVDRSVGLSDLASRAQAGPTPRQKRASCRNPECRDGLTPGTAVVGGGSKGAPIFGAGGVGAKRLMRWAWVRCLACNPPEDARKAGAVYKPLHLSEDEIARRAQLASTKAPYVPVQDSLGKLAGRDPGGTRAPPTSGVDSGKLAELLEQNKQLNERLGEVLKQNVAMTDTLSRMSMQVAALLDDNARLRKEQESRIAGTLILPTNPHTPTGQ